MEEEVDERCREGDVEFFNTAIENNVYYPWYYVMETACYYNQRAIIDLIFHKVKCDIFEIQQILQWGLYGACLGGHEQLAESFITKHGANVSERNFISACEGGSSHLVDFMITKLPNLSKTTLNWACQRACFKKQCHIVDTLISMGVDDFDDALPWACLGGSRELVELMISKGATDWEEGFLGACEGGHILLAHLMIVKNNGWDATHDIWNRGLERACANGHTDIVNLLMTKGIFTKANLNIALYIAFFQKHKHLFKLLIFKGADPCVLFSDINLHIFFLNAQLINLKDKDYFKLNYAYLYNCALRVMIGERKRKLVADLLANVNDVDLLKKMFNKRLVHFSPSFHRGDDRLFRIVYAFCCQDIGVLNLAFSHKDYMIPTKMTNK